MTTPPARNAPEQNQQPLDVVILAAGQGTRMRSARPKVLHEVAGRSMVGWAVKRAREVGARDVVVVTGHGAELVESALATEGVRFARQDRQLGTGHAFLAGARHLRGDGRVLVLYGDTPLLSAPTLRALLADHQQSDAALTILTAELPDASGYGRIIRGPEGDVQRIVEEKSATPEEKRVREFNSGVYLMNSRAPELAALIGNENAAGEYYLTDLLELYRQEGSRVRAFKIPDADEVMGANDRVQLSQAERLMRARIAERHMRGGVTLHDPATTVIDDDVIIGRDTVVQPGAIILGCTVIGENCTVGAYSVLQDARLADHVTIKPHSVLEDATVGEGSDVGPFARLRPGTTLQRNVHVGNFVEIKNATLADGAKAGHLAYLGDASIGVEANIGAGTITANYNGAGKYRTTIGDGAFIGSNSVLIAPVTVGEGAMVAAGSAVGKDVPAGDLAVARGDQRNVPGWSRRFWKNNADRVRGKLNWITRWVEANENVTDR